MSDKTSATQLPQPLVQYPSLTPHTLIRPVLTAVPITGSDHSTGSVLQLLSSVDLVRVARFVRLLTTL